MKVLLTGSSGLIGTRLAHCWESTGHEAWRLVRSGMQQFQRSQTWNPAQMELNAAEVSGFDAVIHLAGENIAGGRWSRARKQRIHSSRAEGTRLLCEGLAAAKAPPAVLVSASAIGFYGDRGAEQLDESSEAGEGFLAEVTQAWESACEPARAAGIRTVNLRLGVVLAADGGALSKMLTPFRLGLGGKLGSGEQFMSWIALKDVIRAINFVIDHKAITGPVNCVAPNPVTNAQFTKLLASVLRRPSFAAVPALVLRMALGEMADALLLTGQRVTPKVLEQHGFQFELGDLKTALRAILTR